MVAAKESTVTAKAEALTAMFEALREACTLFHETKGMHETVAAKYGLKPEDAMAYFFRLCRLILSFD
jgi:formate dehydrogenase assembly factor FdhD